MRRLILVALLAALVAGCEGPRASYGPWRPDMPSWCYPHESMHQGMGQTYTPLNYGGYDSSGLSPSTGSYGFGY